MQVCDELADGGFGWIDDGFMRRCSHALVVDGSVFVIDPFDEDGLDDRIRAAGEPAGVIQLLDRHNRDCAELARRLRVPLHYLDAPGPFRAIPLATPPRWNEIALWWPERRVLVCGDALGSLPDFFRTPRERLGVHPLLRMIPPRRLARLDPEHVLVGHGQGVHEGATAALREALAMSRRRLPAVVAATIGSAVRARRSK